MDSAGGSMLDWFIIIAYFPTLGGILMYVIKLEIRMAKMCTNIKWIRDLLKSSGWDPEG